MRLSWYHVGFCLLVFDIIQSDLIFSMVDESLDRFFFFISSIGIVQSLSMPCSIRAFAGHFGRVRSDSTSLERFEVSMSFV